MTVIVNGDPWKANNEQESSFAASGLWARGSAVSTVLFPVLPVIRTMTSGTTHSRSFGVFLETSITQATFITTSGDGTENFVPHIRGVKIGELQVITITAKC